MLRRFKGLGTIVRAAVAVVVAGLVLKAGAPPAKGVVFEGELVRVIDGDTYIIQPLPPLVRVRMLECWAPESRTTDLEEKQRGLAAKENLKQLLPVGSRIRVRVPTSDDSSKSMTMGRFLAETWRDIDGDGNLDDIAAIQRAAGHATKVKQRRRD